MGWQDSDGRWHEDTTGRFTESPYDPIDLRGEASSDTPYDKDSRRTGQNCYDYVKNRLERYPHEIDGINLEDPTAAMKLVEKLMSEDKQMRTSNSCYAYAGALCAIFDRKGLEYKCYNGVTVKKDESVKRESLKWPVHTWVVHNNKVYATTSGSSSLDAKLEFLRGRRYASITSDVVFKK